MNIQSLSVCVPANNCINNCKFCVSHMREDSYANHLDENLPFYDLYQRDYIKRLEYARDNGCNTIMLTGQAEPQQNKPFLKTFGMLNSMLEKPFRNIEIQTTGVLLDENYLRFLRNHVGVTTISISVSCLDNDETNNEIIQSKTSINLSNLCELIKKYDFNLRLSLNMTKKITVGLNKNGNPDWIYILNCCKSLGADQVTFRKMYYDNSLTPQNKFVINNKIDDDWFSQLESNIKEFGTYLDTLEYGSKRYSYNEMSIVLDEDCMAKSEEKQALKYLILRPNCKLYSKWDDKGSLIF